MQWVVQLPAPEYVGIGSSPGVPDAESNAGSNARSNAGSNGETNPGAASGTTSGALLNSDPGAASSPLRSPASPRPLTAIPSPEIAELPPENSDPSLTRIEGLRITDDGLFVRTDGATPEIRSQRSRDRRTMTITVRHAVLSPQFTERDLAVEQYDIEQLAFAQTSDTPPAVEITLKVDRNSPDWQTSVSGLGGIVLLPPTRSTRVAQRAGSEPSRSESDRSGSDQPERSDSPQAETRSNTRSNPSAAPSQPSPQGSPPTTSAVASTVQTSALIEGIDLDASATQLLIRSDRPVNHVGRWQSGMYMVTLSPARLAEQVTGPELSADSPLLRVRLRQEAEDSVVVMIQPASGVRFGTLNAVTPQLIALDMERSQPSAVTPTAMPAAPVTSPLTSSSLAVNAALPTVPQGQVVVVIDPGHGGADVGAVGIGNLYEANVVLAISQQVGALLQQQGISVLFTRTSDLEIDLEPRVQMAERANATVFVSIHANSMGMDRPDVNGTETYYYSSGAGLAEAIQNSIVSSLDVNDRGVRQARFYVLRHTSMPAVLVETGYVTGSEDAPRLADASFQSQMARAIAQGVLQYVQRLRAGQP